jgi:hypothetical protein
VAWLKIDHIDAVVAKLRNDQPVATKVDRQTSARITQIISRRCLFMFDCNPTQS